MQTRIDNQSIACIITREDLLQDGSLIDISMQAQEAGIQIPMAITAGVAQLANSAVAGPPGQLLRADDLGTIYYDIAWMLGLLLRSSERMGTGGPITFQVWIGGAEQDLVAVCSAEGRNGSPVLTVLLPGED